MSLILRGNKGSKLTASELDGNFEYLESTSGGGSSGPTFEDLILGMVNPTYSISNDSTELKNITLNYYAGNVLYSISELLLPNLVTITGGGSPSGTINIDGSYITTLDLSSLTTIGI